MHHPPVHRSAESPPQRRSAGSFPQWRQWLRLFQDGPKCKSMHVLSFHSNLMTSQLLDQLPIWDCGFHLLILMKVPPEVIHIVVVPPAARFTLTSLKPSPPNFSFVFLGLMACVAPVPSSALRPVLILATVAVDLNIFIEGLQDPASMDCSSFRSSSSFFFSWTLSALSFLSSGTLITLNIFEASSNMPCHDLSLPVRTVAIPSVLTSSTPFLVSFWTLASFWGLVEDSFRRHSLAYSVWSPHSCSIGVHLVQEYEQRYNLLLSCNLPQCGRTCTPWQPSWAALLGNLLGLLLRRSSSSWCRRRLWWLLLPIGLRHSHLLALLLRVDARMCSLNVLTVGWLGTVSSCKVFRTSEVRNASSAFWLSTFLVNFVNPLIRIVGSGRLRLMSSSLLSQLIHFRSAPAVAPGFGCSPGSSSCLKTTIFSWVPPGW